MRLRPLWGLPARVKSLLTARIGLHSQRNPAVRTLRPPTLPSATAKRKERLTGLPLTAKDSCITTSRHKGLARIYDILRSKLVGLNCLFLGCN